MTRPDPVRLAGLPARPAVRPAWRSRRLSWPAAAVPAVDLVALAVAVAAAGQVSVASAGYAAAVLVLLAAAGLMRLRICLRLSDQAGRILAAAAGPAAALLPWLTAGHAWRLAVWSAGCLLLGRGLAYAFVRSARRRGLLAEPALLAGSGETAGLVARLLREHPELGLAAFGFAAPRHPPSELPLPVLGAPRDLPQLVAELGIRRVIVCIGADEDRELVSALRGARLQGADIVVVPDLHELAMAVPRACLDEICGIPVIPLRRPPGAWLVVKRGLDVIVAAVLLCLLGPLVLGLAAIIKISSGGPVIFRQLRVTGAGRAAQVLKLRTLADHSNSDTCWAVPLESCTGFARWLRVSHLDELPQLVNVLRGHMSLVGPRPERPYFAERFGRTIPGYRDRDRMRAGLTGLAQASGLHGDTPLEDRVRLDNSYIEYWSPWQDLVILARTTAKTITGVLGGGR
jgi:lipopolysaccharide/colanic/teichoic acid biosynthesis glycosyltransferase